MLFSEKLKLLRKENNLTQEDLSFKLNVSRQAITKWECNEGIPDICNLKQISRLFNIPIDDLVKEELDINEQIGGKYVYIKELDIDHIKHFDIKICKIDELNLKGNSEEKVKVELLSDEQENIEDAFKIKFDDLYNRLDIDIKSKNVVKGVCANLYLPEKYIDEIELNSKVRSLSVSNLNLNKLEYDGELKYLNVKNSKGRIVLNTAKCDVEANYDTFDGELEVNIINSVARVSIPKGTIYKTVLKGIRNEFVDATCMDDAKNVIELNGINSKLIVIQK